jgi:hypothetical protein
MKTLFKKESLQQAFQKEKLKFLVPLGAAIAVAGGGAALWWVVQQNTPVEGLPVGSEVLPQTTATTLTFTTNEGQWRQLQNYGNPTTRAAVTENFNQLRDRFLNKNGLDFDRDIKPWVGQEITVAFVPPVSAEDPNKPAPIQPFNPNGYIDTPPVFILPIANAARAKEMLAAPKTGSGQQWVERDYKGQKIREVHGKEQPAYAATVIGNRIVVVSPNAKALEQVIDTSKGRPPLSRISEYGQAFQQLKTVAPFLRMYVNIPAAQKMAAGNPSLPIPPQALNLLQNNQGMASTVNLGSEGLRIQGLSWVSPDSKVRYRTDNKAQRMPSLMPTETVMMTSGGSLKQFWQESTQESKDPAPRTAGFSISTVQSGLENLTGMTMQKDFLPWMDGEFSLGLITAPGAGATAPTAGVMFMVQANDRKAAEQSLKKLDQVMKDRYQFQVSQSDAGVVTWVSQFSSLKATHGWLDGNVLYLAIGPGVSELVSPAAGKTLAEDPLFRQATATEMEANNGHFFIDIEPLAKANTALPVPVLPADNRAFLDAIKAIGVTTAVQDGRTFRFDTQVLLKPFSADASPSLSPSPSPSPSASPSP